MTLNSGTLPPVANHCGHNAGSQITRRIDSKPYTDDLLKSYGLHVKKKPACLHPEGHADAKDGDEHDQWNEAGRRGTISFIRDCEHHQQEDEGAE